MLIFLLYLHTLQIFQKLPERKSNAEGTAGARRGSYSPDNIEVAKKQLARSDRLLQQLVRTFGKFLIDMLQKSAKVKQY